MNYRININWTPEGEYEPEWRKMTKEEYLEGWGLTDAEWNDMVESKAILSLETRFWSRNDDNFWLSNFFPAPIQWDGKEWPTSEHLYQALKFRNESDVEAIRLCKTPKQAKQLARKIRKVAYSFLNPHLMRIAIREKFKQHPDLAEKLIATEGRIIESSPFDSIWGEGPNGDGLNLMGLLLMELRESLKRSSR